MRIREIVELVGAPAHRGPGADQTIEDLRDTAARYVPRAVMDFVEGGSDEEHTARWNRSTLQQQVLAPRVAAGIGTVDLSRTVLGTRQSVPFIFGPTGFTGLVRPRGEQLVAQAAHSSDVPYVVSAVASTTPLSAIANSGDLWLNLYPLKDHGLMTLLMDAAWQRGYRNLVLTIDVPVAGARHRDVRNGLALPPRITLRTLADGVRHPRWSGAFLRGPSLTIPDVTVEGQVVSSTEFPHLFRSDFDWSYIDGIVGQWPGPVVLKGILSTEDAVTARSVGARGIVVSNHGGRQLDGSPAAFDVLPPIVDAVGADLEVLVDSGFRTGKDIAAALARGATAVLLGRAYLYGLAAHGKPGVERVAEILRSELTRSLHLAGIHSVDALGPAFLAD